MLKKILRELGLLELYTLKKIGPLVEDGWLNSYRKGQSVDKNNNPIPWITYPCYDFIKERVKKEFTVFEYGCGNSTLWWSKNVSHIVAVEHNKQWHQKILGKVGKNVELVYKPLSDEYFVTANAYGKIFDIIVIDGVERNRSLMSSFPNLKDDGVFVFDNSDRNGYEEAHVFLAKNNFKKLPFKGLAPILNRKTETSIFYRSGNCLGI